MWALAFAARRRGYDVINWHYRSPLATVDEHASQLARELAPRLEQRTRVHFITHSLGGIIVRRFLEQHPLPNLGRVVMLAPPNGGSEVAARVQPLACVIKPIRDLAPRDTPRASFEVGIIAGSRSRNPLFARWINAPNDGTVAVERTKLEGMRDFIVLPRTHTALPWSRDAIDCAFRFVERGRFAA